MSTLDHTLEEQLQIPVFSKENLKKLLAKNEIDFDPKHENFRIEIIANLGYSFLRGKHLPPLFVSADEPQLSYSTTLSSQELETHAKVAEIQIYASGDDNPPYSDYGCTIFRKLATAVSRLEEMQKIPEMKTPNFRATQYLIRTLISDGRKKLENTVVSCGLLRDIKLLNLKGGQELFEKAIAQSLEFDVFEDIRKYEESIQKKPKSVKERLRGSASNVEPSIQLPADKLI